MKEIKKFIGIYLIFLCAVSPAYSQSVVSERIADLMPQNYAITGDAVLQLLDNGALKLSLTSDFTTPRGPDVRILLGNELSLSGAEEIVNLTDLNHFGGAATFDVPENIGIDDFNFVLFYCVQFQQFWASGELVESGDSLQDSTCQMSTVSLINGAQSVEICSNDNQADVIAFTNSLNAVAGENYAYLITDENEIVQDVVLDSTFDFEGSTMAKLRVYGIHFQGDLTVVLDGARDQTTASICFTHSESENFVAIVTDHCPDQFKCVPTLVATAGWVGEVSLCPNDGEADLIELRNNIDASTNDHYAYLITDSNEILQEVVLDTIYDFEGSGTGTQRVYGIHYDGMLQAAVGQVRKATTATGCFSHSNDTTFLTVIKSACDTFECVESLVATYDWVTSIDLCEDVSSSRVFVQNNIQVKPGQNYAFILTDTNEIVQEVFLDTIYNFENADHGVYRIYGLSYAGELQEAIGQHRSNITASDCAFGSGNGAFLTVFKSASCLTSTLDPHLAALVNIYPNPSLGFIEIDVPPNFEPLYGRLLNMFHQPIQLFHWDGDAKMQLELQSTASGVYIIQLVDNDHRAYHHKIQVF